MKEKKGSERKMNKGIKEILQLALDTEDIAEKNAYIRSAALLIEETRQNKSFPKQLSEDELLLKKFRRYRKDNHYVAWYLSDENELEFAKEWYQKQQVNPYELTCDIVGIKPTIDTSFVAGKPPEPIGPISRSI